LPGGSMIFIWWKLKMSYHNAYPNWDSPAVVCHFFCISSYVDQQLHLLVVKILYITTL
jgi:hypothetical protein